MAKNRLRGRFSGEMNKRLERFSSSLEVDKEMVAEDIWTNQAHTLMLVKQGIIDRKAGKKILAALEKIRKEEIALDPSLEDIHMNIEAMVAKEAGEDAAGKMHTARSRNDQVQTDIRLHLREKILEIEESILLLQVSLLKIAEKNTETLMPSYTHTQHAQPITLGYWATAYSSILIRDLERLRKAYSTVNRNPLGSCALAGTSFPIDREYTTELLGFDAVEEHALDAVSSRDHMIEAAAALAILAGNLSRLAEEIILFSTTEYAILELSDEYSTGSSIMPQKKNPDPAELIRGMTGYAYGNLMQALTLVKALPMGYSRDLQEDRSMLWKTIDRVNDALIILEGALSTARFKEKRMQELAGEGCTTATELANYLTREKKIAFRKAHEITGEIVREAQGKELDAGKVTATLKKHRISAGEKEIKKVLDPLEAVKAAKSLGATSPDEVRRIIKGQIEKIKASEEEIKKRKARTYTAREKTEKEIAKTG